MLKQDRNNIYIIGAKASGMNLVHLINGINSAMAEKIYYIKGFIDEDKSFEKYNGYDVFHNFKDCYEFKGKYTGLVTSGIGNGINRVRLLKSACCNGFEVEKIYGKGSNISADVFIGEGCIIGENCIIRPFVRLGDYVYLHANSFIGCNVKLGTGCTVNCGVNISANTKVGNYTMVGSGAVVIQDLVIGDDVFVGAGSVVVDDIPSGEIWVGNPAKFLKKNVYK